MAGLHRLIFRTFMISFILVGMALLERPASAVTPSAGGEIYIPFVQRNNPNVCGEIRVDTVWTAAEGPYLITCDVVVTNTVTLTITEGTTVMFDHAEDDLIIHGGLQARGTQDSPLRFQPTSATTPGSWGRLYFFWTSTVLLDHAILEYGGSGNGMIYIENDRVEVLNSVVQYSASEGISIFYGAPLISNTQILSNTAINGGGGLNNDSGSPRVVNNTFAGNTCTGQPCYGGALFNFSGNPTVKGNIFIGNSADYGGGVYNGIGSPIIENNHFSGNQASLGGGLYNESGALIVRNNTFIQNSANGNYGNLGGGLYNYSGKPTVYNNIIADNTAEGGGGGIYNLFGIISMDYNDVWNNTGGDTYNVPPGVHDISADPILVDPSNGDLHLAPGSPCVDTGDPYDHPEIDFDGQPRPMGLAADIGADEASNLRVAKSSTPDEVSPGALVTYTIELANPEPLILYNVLLTDTLPVAAKFLGYQAEGLTCSHEGVSWGGNLFCVLAAPEFTPGEERVLTVSVILTDTGYVQSFTTNHVTATASTGGETLTAHDGWRLGVNWCAVRLNETPVGGGLQSAIDASTLVTDVIKVSGYCRLHDISLNKTLTMQGGWSQDFKARDPEVYITTLDAQSQGKVLMIEGDVSPTISGFTITGGYASEYSGGISISSGSPAIEHNIFMHNDSHMGGGLYNGAGSPEIQNNTFMDNLAGYGGGLYNESGSPTIQDNSFIGNYAYSGGGLYTGNGDPLIQYNRFTGNINYYSHVYQGAGGGLYNLEGNPTIQFNIFTSNLGYWSGGGLHNYNGSPTIQGNVFSGNSVRRLDGTGYGGGMGNVSGSPTIQNNIFIRNSVYAVFNGSPAGYGGGFATNLGNANILNNTFIENFASQEGGGIAILGSTPNIYNNIVVNNNAPSGGGIASLFYSVAVLDYNDVWNNVGGNYSGITPGAHDTSVDPLLVDPANGDFHLAPGSPCINAGDPANYPPTDFEGEVRPNGSAPDIGADEYYP